MTPRELAHSVAVDWLEAAYKGATNQLTHDSPAPSLLRERKKQVAKLREELMHKAGLEGLPLEPIQTKD